MTIMFFVIFGLIAYAFLGYPFLLLIRKRVNFTKDEDFQSTVSLIITAHNEETVIDSKLRNSLSLDYPKEQLQLIVVSDGSTDKTVEIASQFESVRILKLERGGKTASQNEAVKVASGDILVFSDANSHYSRDAMRKLIRNFKDPSVGAVCGELRYKGRFSRESLYWKYEVTLKRLEGKTGDLLGANGSIYALRRECYEPLPPDAISDFLEPIIIRGNGMKVIYEREAIAWEKEPGNTFQRKRRIILRALRSIRYLKTFLNPLKHRYLSWSLFSHKVLRWLMPYFLMFLALLNLLLIKIGLFQITFICQLIFYGSAIFSKSVWYFILVNSASCVAIVDWVRGKRIVTWHVER